MKVCEFCGTRILVDDVDVDYKGAIIHQACFSFAADINWVPPKGEFKTTLTAGHPPIREEIKLDQIAIGTITWREFKPWYVTSMMNTMKVFGTDFDYFVVQGLYIISARNILVQQVMKVHETSNIKGILWIDADMMWEPDDVKKILDVATMNRGAVVGCLYPGREGEMTVGKVFDSGDVGPADILGFGFTYTPIECFMTLPEPWFFNEWERGNIVGEDAYFCRQQREYGRKVLGIRNSKVKHAYEPGPRGLAGHVGQILGDDGVRFL